MIDSSVNLEKSKLPDEQNMMKIERLMKLNKDDF